MKNRPNGKAIGFSVGIIKNEGGYTNKSLAAELGISAASLSNYIHSKIIPNIEVIGRLFAVIQNFPHIDTEKKDNLRECLTQVIVPHVKYAYKFEKKYEWNPLEAGINISESARTSPRVYEASQDAERRRKLSNSKIKLLPTTTPEAQLIDILLQTSRFPSMTDLGIALGVNKHTISRIRAGEVHAESNTIRKLKELARNVLQQIQNESADL